MNTTEKIMKTTFTKDVANNKMFITREFAGTVEDVWKAWTDPKLLDQWWAPKPWKARNKIYGFPRRRPVGILLCSALKARNTGHWPNTIKLFHKKVLKG